MTEIVNTARRGLMLGAAALPLAGGVLAGAAGAAVPAPQGVLRPGAYRFKVGAFEVTSILDGAVQLDGPHPIFGQNVTQDDVASLAAENFLPPTRMEIPFTVTLVNTGSELILFDTGNGDNGRRPAAGRLVETLGTLGIQPGDITHVVITHFHGDHISGLTEDGAPTFPNAAYVFGAAEYDFWSNEDLLFDEAMQSRAQLVQDKVVPFAEQATMINPGDAVRSGIEAVDNFGHTPGHMAYHLESEGARLMITADSANHYVMSLQRPDWHVRFDMDKEKAAAARRSLFGMIAADKIPFIGYHMPPPAVGYVEPLGEGFRFVPASYQLNL
ncbi:MAG: MBL fold metallo-hydrolase [Pseudomonadota bacterium]